MNVLKRLLLSIGILTASVTAYATPIYTQQNPSATQAGAFNVVGGTITTKLSLPFLTPSSYVQTDAQGNLVTPSPSVTNYIQNRSGLQAGATAYPDFLYVGSSATIPSLGVTTATITGLTGSTITYSSATFVGVAGSTISYSSATFTNITVTGGAGSVSVSSVTASSGTITKLSVSTLTATNIVGTTTNDNASLGNFGAFVSSLTTNAAAISGTNGAWGDFGSIQLTAGDWDVSLMCLLSRNGATYNGVQSCGIGTAAGNSATGIVDGDNQAYGQQDNTSSISTVTIPPWRASISATTTYYGKVFTQVSAGTAKAYGRISARRVR